MADYNKPMGVFDLETGVVEEEYIDGLKTARKKTKEEKQNDKTQMKIRKMRDKLDSMSFVITSPEVSLKLASVLKKSELQMFYRLLSYLDFNSGVLLNPDGKYLNLDYFIKNTIDSEGTQIYARQTVYNIMAVLRKNDLIKKTVGCDESKSCFIVNPWVAFKGKGARADSTLLKQFMDSDWENVRN